MAEIIRSAALETIPHGFSTRNGLAGEDVLPGAALVKLTQIHSSDVIVVDEVPQAPREGDALVTGQHGVLLGIVTADCAPVLFADRRAGVIGAAHAGWRGARGGVLENTIAAMERLGARRDSIISAIGPTIAQPSYEVDRDFRTYFEVQDEIFFASGAGEHLQFDLPAYVAHRLRRAGVERIDNLALDTYTDPARFFSYRRASHHAEPTGGRQISVIGLL